ncbi:DEAD/DEAH box helicase [Halorussus limi]|uniref:DEAD/DEAH box helicase n=2 Tax=Halorussus TaxID=1070314 RepID=A0A8U0IH25_9EURY|nr:MULTISPECIES: DEAD/DEAH box helicase [Halorussus]UPV73938.1 DEAD/DEAH box helicase [Halorussus limi]UPV99980.1 DEAD/DEAH box helicase [Halorussus gelatinilyticus]
MSDNTTSTDANARADVDADTIIDTFPRTSLTPDSEYLETIGLPAEPADTVPTAEVLRPELAEPYPHDLFSHQADALNALETGDNVAVTTSTSSGKTHIYGLQIARNLLDAGVLNPDGTRAAEHNDASTALCVYPMKALTKDQQEALDELYDQLGLDIRVEIYDGDTTGNRRAIREQADVILTNFAGLNVYLEHHDKWSRFYSALDLVAIDESHTYTGIEGMHVAWILRRMQRVADYWGGDPQYVLTSATIGNPRDHSEELINASVTVIDDDGSPHGPRDVILWNPPPRDKTQDPTPEEETFDIDIDDANDPEEEGEEFIAERVPASVEAPKVFNHLTSRGIRTLLFCDSRKLTELSIQRADEHRRNNPREYDHPTTVGREAYNAGLGRHTRHSREHQFKTGVLTGLATTSALELGIDIGNLDATVLMGYPGQRQSFWQRIGRAGREASRSLAVLVGDHRTLDQYILNHPEYLLENDVEDAVVDTSNNSVFATHVLAAADEIALDESDIGTFADEDRLRAAVKMWREAGFVDGYLDAAVHYSGPSRPQTRVNLYGTTDTDYRLQLAADVDRDKWGLPDDLDLEPIEQNRAYRDYHEGAVRLQNGQQFEVVNVDEDRPQPIIELKPVDCEYYTRTRNKVNVLDAESEESREVNGFTLHFGRGTVLVHHHSYDQLYIGNSDPKQQAIPTETPPILMDTQLCWVEVPEDVETALTRKYQDYGIETGVDPENTGIAHLGYIAGLHAAEHATIQTAPLELRVDKNDLGGLATLVMDTHYAHPDYDDITDSIGDSFEAATHALEQRTQELTGRTASGWFIYDGVDGGLGFARAIYENFEALAERARDQLRDCHCGQPNGCPACTFDENCGNDNKPLLRASAVDVLNQLLGDDTREDLSEHLPEDEHGGDRRPVVFYS